jgi:hypothetical protein
VATPAGLVSKATQRLQRRPQPTLKDVLTGGPQAPPISDESLAGLSVQADLAYRQGDDLEALDTAHRKAAEARKAADDKLWEQINKRRSRAVQARISNERDS